jgi:tetratricopeptide (TPR) repeat protein
MSYCRSRTTVLLLLGALGFPVLTQAQQHGPAAHPRAPRAYVTAPVTALEAGQWRADLSALVEGMQSLHANLYHTMTREQLERAVRELDVRIHSLAAHEIIVEMARIVALVGDGHTSLALYFARGVDFHVLPLRLGVYEDGVFVEAADQAYSEIVGGRVVAIGRAPIDTVMARVTPIISRDNDNWIPAVAPNLLNRAEVLHALRLTDDVSGATLTVEKNGRTRAVRVAALPDPPGTALGLPFLARFTNTWVDARDQTLTAPPLYQQRFDERYFYEYLPAEGLLYIKFDQVQNRTAGETALSFFARAMAFARERRPAKTVIDIRNNTGGEGGMLAGIVREIVRTREVDETGKLFVIIGRRTFSAAQILATQLETYTRAIFVGEPTSSRPNVYGGHVFVHLPNSGIAVAVSPAWYQSAFPHDVRTEIRPRVAAVPVFADYYNNRDPALDAILRWRGGAMLADSVHAAVARDDTARAERLIQEYGAHPVNRFVDAAVDVNNAGYRFLNAGQTERALWLFRLNVRVHPRYPNGWDSLGEALVRAGLRAEAIAAFRRALELQPEYPPSAEWLRRLGAGR